MAQATTVTIGDKTALWDWDAKDVDG